MIKMGNKRIKLECDLDDDGGMFCVSKEGDKAGQGRYMPEILYDSALRMLIKASDAGSSDITMILKYVAKLPFRSYDSYWANLNDCLEESGQMKIPFHCMLRSLRVEAEDILKHEFPKKLEDKVSEALRHIKLDHNYLAWGIADSGDYSELADLLEDTMHEGKVDESILKGAIEEVEVMSVVKRGYF